MAKTCIVVITLMALSFSLLASAFDEQPLQDFCVAKATSPVNVNGKTCKEASSVTVNDFVFTGLHLAGNTTNPAGFSATQVFATQLPGLNTLGISMLRFDFAPRGVNAPHVHPRATEMITVLDGTLEVGFITSAPDNKLFVKVLQKGDAFVFPVGLVHYQRNVGYGNAVAIVALNGQNPGLVSVPSTVFGSNPAIPSDTLAKSFQVGESTVEVIQSKF